MSRSYLFYLLDASMNFLLRRSTVVLDIEMYTDALGPREIQRIPLEKKFCQDIIKQESLNG